MMICEGNIKERSTKIPPNKGDRGEVTLHNDVIRALDTPLNFASRSKNEPLFRGDFKLPKFRYPNISLQSQIDFKLNNIRLWIITPRLLKLD